MGEKYTEKLFEENKKTVAESEDGHVEVNLIFFEEYLKWKQIALEWKYRAYWLLGILATFAAILLGFAVSITVGVI